MEDILIVKGAYLKKTVITGLSDRGKHWIFNNMKGEQPITIETEHADDLIKLITADGLSVIER